MDAITILIVDDHDLFLEGTEILIKRLASSVGKEVKFVRATSLAELREIRSWCFPDVVILDYHLTDMQGKTLIREVKTTFPNSKLIVISSENTSEVLSVVEEYADQFMYKGDSRQKWEYQMHDQIFGSSSRSEVRVSCEAKVDLLTFRQAEVLQHSATGKSNKDIAYLLGIKEGTVKKHRSDIFEKLQVGNLAQALHKARELGILK